MERLSILFFFQCSRLYSDRGAKGTVRPPPQQLICKSRSRREGKRVKRGVKGKKGKIGKSMPNFLFNDNNAVCPVSSYLNLYDELLYKLG